MKLKNDTINVHGLSNELLLGMMIINNVFVRNGVEPRITCLLDYKHSYHSEHYKGDAVDIGSKEFSTELKHKLLSEIQERINCEYRIILENEGGINEHYHFEYNPIYQSN